MPQIQIIGQEAVQDQNNQATQALDRSKFVADSMYKAQQLKFYADNLKYEMKKTDDEAKKATISQNAADAALASDVMKNCSSIAEKHGPEAAQKYLLGVMSQRPELFLGLKDFYNKLPDMKQGGNERIMNSVADRMTGGQQGMPQVPGAEGAQPGVMNQAQAGAVSGQMPQQEMPVLTGISGGNPQISFPEQEARNAAIKNTAVLNSTKEVEMKPIRASVENYIQTFDRAVEEMGGLSDNALEALMKGKGAEIASQIGNMPNVFALNKLIESVSLQLGSYLNKGRPTDKDQAAAKDALTRLSYTKGVNAILRNYLNTISSTGDKELATKVFWSLAKEGGSKSSDAKAFGSSDMFSNKPATSRFTIRVKQ